MKVRGGIRWELSALLANATKTIKPWINSNQGKLRHLTPHSAASLIYFSLPNISKLTASNTDIPSTCGVIIPPEIPKETIFTHHEGTMQLPVWSPGGGVGLQ